MVAKSSIGKLVSAAVGLFIISLAAAWASEFLRSFLGTEVSIWLPAGFLLAAALASPRSTWLIWAAAAILAEFTGNLLWYNHQLGPATLLAFGNAFAALIGAAVVRDFLPTGLLLTSLKKTTFLLLVISLIVPTLSATSASIALGWSYGKALSEAWIRVFLGDFTGAILAAPLALLALRTAAPKLQMNSNRWLESAALIAIFAVSVAVSLGGIIPFAFLLTPSLLWAALRFRIPGAILAISALAICSVIFTIYGLGPFSQNRVNDDIENEVLQLFLVVTSITGLLIGALSEENREGIIKLYEANDALELRVEERSASLIKSETQARETANLLSAIGESCPDLIYAKDLDYAMIYANNATLLTLGAGNLDELKRFGESHFYSASAEHELIRQNDKRVLDTKKTLVIEEVVTNPAGERRVYRASKSPLYDAVGDLAGLAGVSVDITDIKRSQARETMLVREVEHRSRNMLAVVQGIVALSRADTVSDMKRKLQQRILALAKTNGAIAAADWHGVSLKQIVESEIAPYRDEYDVNVQIEGEDVGLDPATAQSFTLVIHELTTNAAKYGALSSAAGRVTINWNSVRSAGKQNLITLHWIEEGGPPVQEPDRKGFGTTMIGVFGQEHADSSVDFSWEHSGLKVRLTMPVPKASASNLH